MFSDSSYIFQIVGTINSFMFLLCLSGLVHQIKNIVVAMIKKKHHVTKVLSLNQFSSSYLSFYGIYVYSFLIQDINYFLFYTRLFACLLTLVIIILIAIDRKNIFSTVLVFFGVMSIFVSIMLFNHRSEFKAVAIDFSILIILISTFFLAQGGAHQIYKIRKEKSVGALSLPMNLTFFLKDMSNVAFALVMKFNEGWPLLVMGIVSGALKLGVLYNFYWIKKVPHAV